MTGDEEKNLLDNFWGPRARQTEAVHYKISASYALWHDCLTLAVIVLTTVTGSTLFTNLSGHRDLTIVLASLSIAAAVLAAIDRSVRYAERAEQHRRAGAAWCPIVNETESITVQLPAHPVPDDRIQSLEAAMSRTTNNSPYIPQRYFKKYGLMDTYMYPVSKRPWYRWWRR